MHFFFILKQYYSFLEVLFTFSLFFDKLYIIKIVDIITTIIETNLDTFIPYRHKLSARNVSIIALANPYNSKYQLVIWPLNFRFFCIFVSIIKIIKVAIVS